MHLGCRILSLVVLGAAYQLRAQSPYSVEIRGRVLAYDGRDTLPSGSSEIRMPAARYRTQTDTSGRFAFTVRLPTGCHSLYLPGHIYHLKVLRDESVRVPTIVLPPSSGEITFPTPLDTLGHCTPTTPEPPYDWPVWHAVVAGRVEYPSGEPRVGQLVILRCLGIIPEPDVPPDKRTRYPVFVTDSRPITDSLGYFSARPLVKIDRASWIENIEAVPCTAIIWAPPFDSLSIRLRFWPDTVPPLPVQMRLVSDIVRHPTVQDFQRLPK